MLKRIWNTVVNIYNSIVNLASNIANFIGDILKGIFEPLWNFITKFLNWFNPLSEDFILKSLINILATILDYLNPFSENFFVYKLIELLGDLLKWLFIPSNDYFSNKFDNLLDNFSNRISYQSYLDIFNQTKNIVADEQISIDLDNYKFSNNLSISMSKWIDFDIFDKYKNYYYGFIRGVTFLGLVFFIINHWYKLIRGKNLANTGKEE